jgi:translation initiation factor 1 (eIF-1/SUI1)
MNCQICGLPPDVCTCKAAAPTGVELSTQKVKYGACVTKIRLGECDPERLKEITKELKSTFACGGWVEKNGTIGLQGNHTSPDAIQRLAKVLGVDPAMVKTK